MPDRIYLRPEEFVRKRGVHTHYSSDGAVRTNTNDPPPQLYRLQFTHGVATNVSDELARRMKAEGIASDTRPSLREDD